MNGKLAVALVLAGGLALGGWSCEKKSKPSPGGNVSHFEQNEAAPAMSNMFWARLSGQEQAGGNVQTEATGMTRVWLSDDGQTLNYKLNVRNIENVTAAHIHMGQRGQEGPVVVTLFEGPEKRGSFTGTLAEGKITRDDLTGDLKGKDVSALVDLIRNGQAYINVHTERYPNGEIRGQLNLLEVRPGGTQGQPEPGMGDNASGNFSGNLQENATNAAPPLNGAGNNAANESNALPLQ